MPSGATCQGGVSLKAPSDKSAGPASSSEPVSECTSVDSRRLIVGRCIRSGHAERGARGGPIRAAPCGIFSVCALPWTADNAHYVKLMIMTSQRETWVSHHLGTVLFVVALSGGLRMRKSSTMFCRRQVTKVESH